MRNRTKAVSYAYPSSPHAVLAGKSKEGCYVVALYDACGNQDAPLAFFDSEESAYAFADTLTSPYYKFDIRAYQAHLNHERAEECNE